MCNQASSFFRNVELVKVKELFEATGKCAIDASTAEAAGGESTDSVLDELGELLEAATGDLLLFLECTLNYRREVRDPPTEIEKAKLSLMRECDSFRSDTDIYRSVRRIRDLLEGDE